jgi:predicted Zn-dependent protease with MMP-like domain
MAYHVSKAEFATLVERALEELPPPFAEYLEEISIEIRDRPTRQELRSAQVPPGELLLGLYHGRPQTRRSVMDDMVMPDIVYIFQDHIEQACDSEDELVREVRTTVLHEIGHHFGMSEEDLDALGYG